MTLRLRLPDKRGSMIIILSIILVFGTIVRFHAVIDKSLKFDEIEELYGYQGSFLEICQRSLVRNMPLLYPLIQGLWIRIFGIGPFAVRLPSLIFGVFSLFMVYKLGELAFNNKVGIISALFLTLSSLNIVYSRNARAYSLFNLMTIVSYYFFLKFIKSKRYESHYLISTIILLYTHFFAIFYIIPQFLFLFFRYDLKEIIRKFSKPFLILSLAAIPLILFAIKILFISNDSSLNWLSPPTFFGQAGFGLGYTLVFYSEGLPIFILLLVSTAFLFHKKKDLKTIILFLSWSFFPILIIFIYSLFVKHSFFITWRFFPSQAPIYIILSLGLLRFKKIFGYVFISLISIYFLYLIFSTWSSPPSEDWSGALRTINLNESDYVITLYPKQILYYKDRDCFSEYNFESCMKKDKILYPQDMKDIDESKNQTIYFIFLEYEFENQMRDINMIISMGLLQDSKVIKDFNGLVIVEKPPENP